MICCPSIDSFPSYEQHSSVLFFVVWLSIHYLTNSRVLTDKDEEYEATPEEVDAADDPKDPLCSREALHVHVISMDKIVNALKYPKYAHYSK